MARQRLIATLATKATARHPAGCVMKPSRRRPGTVPAQSLAVRHPSPPQAAWIPSDHGLLDPPRRTDRTRQRSGCTPSAGKGPLQGKNVGKKKGEYSQKGVPPTFPFQFSFHILCGDILNCLGRTSSPGLVVFSSPLLRGYRKRISSAI